MGPFLSGQQDIGFETYQKPNIDKRTLTAKMVLYRIFFRNTGIIRQIAVPKRRGGMGVSGSLFKNVMQTKIKKKRPKT